MHRRHLGSRFVSGLLAAALLGAPASARAQSSETDVPVTTASPATTQTSVPVPVASIAPVASLSPAPAASPSVAPSLPPAGVIPATVSLTLTGTPTVDTTFAYAQILAAIDRQIAPTLRTGASVAYGTISPWPLLPLAIGAPSTLNVAVTISADDDSATVSGTTIVTLESVAVAPLEASLLYLSDDPEYLRQNGLVFAGEVKSGRPARLYYYHSDLGLPRDLDVVLTATVPTRVHLIGSSAGPDQDVRAVGHAVTRDFLQYERANEGIVVDVLPGKPYVVRHALLLQSELIAGALDARVLDGGPLTISVVATAAGERADAYLAGPRVYPDGHHRHGTFSLEDYGSIAASFSVGGPPAVAKIGARAVSPTNVDPKDDGRDYGDYGTIQKLTFKLANPTDDSHKIYLYEKPLAGSVSSSFYVDGQLKELECVRDRQPYTVMTYELPPHSTGATTTVTMPDGGSYYPLEFGVTDTAPNPNTPLLGSPESCTPNTTPSPNPETVSKNLASPIPSPSAPPTDARSKAAP